MAKCGLETPFTPGTTEKFGGFFDTIAGLSNCFIFNKSIKRQKPTTNLNFSQVLTVKSKPDISYFWTLWAPLFGLLPCSI